MALFTIKPPNGASLLTLTNNAASATHSFNDGAKCMKMLGTDTGAGSTERTRFRGKAVPAGSNWEVTVGLWIGPFGRGAYMRTGVALLENSTGKTLAFVHNSNNISPAMSVQYFTGLGTYSATPAANSIYGLRLPILLRIGYDGTNYIFKYSQDFGLSWETLATLAKASYFTADRVGLIVQTFGAVPANQARVDCFYYSDPDFP